MNTKHINLTVTRYEDDADFPEADHYAEFCAQHVASLYPAFEVECEFGPRTQAFVYGADLDGRELEHEISSLLKVDLWDQFCTEGYKAYAESKAQYWLVDYNTTQRIREATAEERKESYEAARIDGGAGVIRVDGRSCYVE